MNTLLMLRLRLVAVVHVGCMQVWSNLTWAFKFEQRIFLSCLSLMPWRATLVRTTCHISLYKIRWSEGGSFYIPHKPRDYLLLHIHTLVSIDIYASIRGSWMLYSLTPVQLWMSNTLSRLVATVWYTQQVKTPTNPTCVNNKHLRTICLINTEDQTKRWLIAFEYVLGYFCHR